MIAYRNTASLDTGGASLAGAYLSVYTNGLVAATSARVTNDFTAGQYSVVLTNATGSN